MKKTLTILSILTASVTASFAQNWQWAKQAQFSARNNEIEGATINNNGESFICGYYITTLNIGTATTLSVNFPGDYQDYVAKYDAAGNPVWLRNIDPQQPDATSGMEISSDTLGNCYVSSGNGYVSSTPGSIFNYASSYGGFHQLQKINSAGGTVWSQSPSFASSSGCTFESMKTDGAGNTYITGPFQGNVTFGSITLSSPSVEDVFVVKYDPSGAVVYAVQATLNGSAKGHGIDVDYAGNVVVVGEFQSAITFGTFNLTSNGARDYFIARLDPAGNFLWAKSDGSSSNDDLYGVAIDYPRIYVTGSFNANFTMGSLALNTHGGQDSWVACTNMNGNELWAHANGGGNSNDIGYDIATDHNGGVYASGNYDGPATFGSTNLLGTMGAYLVKYDIIGIQQWTKTVVGSSMSASGKSLSANRNSEVLMGSAFCCYGSTVNFSGSAITLSANGGPGNYGSAFYLAKVGNCNLTVGASSNTSIICGDTTTITATGGTSFSWSPFNGLSATNTATVNAHPVVTTTYTCTVGDITGCSATATVTVTVTGGPTISLTGATSICQGASTQLTAGGATTYSWTPTTGVSNPNIDNPTITPTGTTTYSVTGTDAFGCATTTPVTITVNPLPTAPVISQNLYVLSSTAATTYQWNMNGGAINLATSQNYTVTQNGIYTVTITNIYGCEATSAPFLFTTVGVSDIANSNLVTVIPNPMVEDAVITLGAGVNLEHGHIKLLDMLGRVVADENFTDHKLTIKRNNLNSGVYFYYLLDGETLIATSKLMVK